MIKLFKSLFEKSEELDNTPSYELKSLYELDRERPLKPKKGISTYPLEINKLLSVKSLSKVEIDDGKGINSNVVDNKELIKFLLKNINTIYYDNNEVTSISGKYEIVNIIIRGKNMSDIPLDFYANDIYTREVVDAVLSEYNLEKFLKLLLE